MQSLLNWLNSTHEQIWIHSTWGYPSGHKKNQKSQIADPTHKSIFHFRYAHTYWLKFLLYPLTQQQHIPQHSQVWTCLSKVCVGSLMKLSRQTSPSLILAYQWAQVIKHVHCQLLGGTLWKATTGDYLFPLYTTSPILKISPVAQAPSCYFSAWCTAFYALLSTVSKIHLLICWYYM